MNKTNDAYSVPTVIFILTFLTMVLSFTLLFVSFNLGRAESKLKKYNGWDDYYSTLDKVLVYFKKDVQENYTSKKKGWFAELPDEIDNFKITYTVEDCKIDINHVDAQLFFNTKNGKKQIFTGKIKDYLYYPDDIKKYLASDASDDILKCLTIYGIPNLNIADIDRLKLYMKSWNLDEGTAGYIADKLKSVRKVPNYLRYNGTNRIRSGLLLDKMNYENFKSSKWQFDDQLFMLFDYTGQINLNFVDEKTFELCIDACGPKGANYNNYWSKVSSMRENDAIDETQAKDIFGSDWLYYEKIFGVDSKLIWIKIEKDDKVLRALVRRYKDRESKVKILKIEAIKQ